MSSQSLAQTIPPGLCQCGCGQKTWIATESRGRFGWVKGEPVRFVRGHAPRATKSAYERVIDRTLLGDDCWTCDLVGDKRGYVQVSVGKKHMGAHRVVYEELVGDIPPGHDLHHRCDVRNCVRPSHLEPLTPRDHHRLEKRRSQCHRGHPLTGDNLYIAPSGMRQCRTCSRLRMQTYRAQERALTASPTPANQ